MNASPNPWDTYGRALTAAMAEVLDEVPDEVRAHVLETADYWISVGLTLGLEHPGAARRLLERIETDAKERAALLDDASAFLAEALA
ncbi:MAG TPA: hypothetical protein VNF73_13050 [Candidatus Saccharimonadales bacterium]|nr:hypothetical protein [Candidatus Saccharimonadales bacterium]